jgi:ElaB/YqjD/DUF883 family membrane-anchored ribosome-binding protein
MTDAFNGSRLAEELRALMSDAEALLRTSAAAAGGAAQEHAEATVAELRGRLAGLEGQVKARARDLDSYVRDNPWQAVAIAGGVALLLGLIMSRRG